MKKELIWQEPSLDNLNESIMHILYTYTPESAERAEQVNLLKSIAEKDHQLNPDIIIGALLVVYGSIEKTYKKYSKVYTYFHPPESSKLYAAIQKALCLDLGNMDESSKFIYLSRFRQYLENNQEQQYLKETKNQIKSLLKKNKVQHKISALTRRLPTHHALKYNFGDIPNHYAQARKNLSGTERVLSLFMNTQSSSRKKAIRFLQILDDRLEHANNENDYLIRFGAMLNVMHQIENEYRFTSPTHSHLYKELQKVTNLKNTFELSHELTKKAIIKLDDLLIEDRSNTKDFNAWKDKNVTSTDLREIENQLLEYRTEITKYREGEFSNNSSLNNLLRGFLELTVRTASHAGVIYACYQIAHLLVTTKMSYASLLVFASPQSAALVMASVWILNQLRNSMTDIAAQKAENIITRHIRTPLQKIMSQKPIFSSLENEINLDVNDQEFIAELYHSPNDIFSEKEKNHFEKIFPDEILNPVHDTPQIEEQYAFT